MSKPKAAEEPALDEAAHLAEMAARAKEAREHAAGVQEHVATVPRFSEDELGDDAERMHAGVRANYLNR